jgi:iron complex transport system substrate-binding protein
MCREPAKKWFNGKVIALTLLPVILLSGCAKSEPATATVVTKSDVYSIAITPVEKLGTMRIVALANGVAELINAMGYHTNLVGRDIASTTDDLTDVPIVTSGHQVIPETIIALKPTVVIIDSATGPQSAITKIRNSGIKVVTVSQSWNMKDVTKKIAQLGVALGAPKTAQLLGYKLEVTTDVNKVTASSDSKRPKIAFLYLRGTSSIYLVGGKGSGADYLIAAAGGIDVGAKALAKPFNPLTAETMATLDPDIILVMIGGLESVGGLTGLQKLPGVAQTSAGKKGKVVAVDDSLLLSFGPRTPSLIERLTAAFTGLS